MPETKQIELLSNPEQLENELSKNLLQLENEPSGNPEKLKSISSANYLTLTDPGESIKALETMYELSMLQTDVDMDAELRAFLTHEKICINELLNSLK